MTSLDETRDLPPLQLEQIFVENSTMHVRILYYKYHYVSQTGENIHPGALFHKAYPLPTQEFCSKPGHI